MRQTNLQRAIRKEAARTGLCAVTPIWISRTSGNKLESMFRTRLLTLLQESIRIVDVWGREQRR